MPISRNLHKSTNSYRAKLYFGIVIAIMCVKLFVYVNDLGMTLSNPKLWLLNASMPFSCPKGEEQARMLKAQLQAVLDSSFAVLQLRHGDSWSVQVESLFGWGKAQLPAARLVDTEVEKFFRL